MDAKPSLIEPGIRNFVTVTLKQCHQFKEKNNNLFLNISLFLGFLIVLGILLIYKYRGKLTPEEIEEKENEKKNYILSRIYNYQQAKKHAQQELITGLPNWESEFDIVNDTVAKKLR